MEHQPGFSEYEFAGKRKVTRREKFLASMEEVVPWDDLLAAIKPAYPDGRRGRPPIGLERGLLMREGKIDWQIAKRRQPIRKIEDGPEKDGLLAEEKAKASVRAFVEHPFHILKNLFRHRKTRYRGLEKNHHQLQVLFGLGNLVVAARKMA
jgi:Transposase DDE domain